MPEIDPVLSKMMFQKVFRAFLFLIGLAILFVGAGMLQNRQLLEGSLAALIGLGLLILPFLSAFKEAIELD